MWLSSKSAISTHSWADMAKVLAGAPIFVTAYIVTPAQKGWEIMVGSALDDLQRPALIQGVQYLWEKECLDQNMSLLWRTSAGKRVGDARGYSGSVLCMGEPHHKEVKAVLFQNFQQYWQEYPKRDVLSMYIKGGYFLPPEIRKSTIIDCGQPTKSNYNISTFPRSERYSQDSRRSVSDNVWNRVRC
jgi:hypothetical protein